MNRIGQIAAEAPADTIASVGLLLAAEVNRTWARAVTAEGAPVDGWVDDFFLRGVVHRSVVQELAP